jgi:hypothetical protein
MSSKMTSARVDQILMCGVLTVQDQVFLVDLDRFNDYLSAGHKFEFVNGDDLYPSYANGFKRVSLQDFILGSRASNRCILFKNGNQRDLRRQNVQVTHEKHMAVSALYQVIEYIPGHTTDQGIHANVMKNPMWRVRLDDGQERIVMYCETDTYTLLCDQSLAVIREFEKNLGRRLTFYKLSNGYILAGAVKLYMHQIITGCYGNGRGTKVVSVDHIDQNPLNNTWDNLRIATREEQEQNSNGIKEGTKRRRMGNARDLPDGITHDMLRKYVVYYEEIYNKEKNLMRNYFRIEGHPKLGKNWESTKSMKVDILAKLAAANKVVDDLANDIHPQTFDEQRGLPAHVTLVESRGKPHLVYDRRLPNKTRIGLRMVLDEGYLLEAELDRLFQKLGEKYPDQTF